MLMRVNMSYADIQGMSDRDLHGCYRTSMARYTQDMEKDVWGKGSQDAKRDFADNAFLARISAQEMVSRGMTVSTMPEITESGWGFEKIPEPSRQASRVMMAEQLVSNVQASSDDFQFTGR